MKSQIISRGSFNVLGVMTSVRTGTESSDLFGGIWKRFERHRDRIENLAIETAYYGVSFPNPQVDVTEYVAGMAVADDCLAPNGLILRRVDGGQFAVFECALSRIGETYRKILGVWLPGSGYVLAEEAPSYERYPRAGDEEKPVRIHIPVRSPMGTGLPRELMSHGRR